MLRSGLVLTWLMVVSVVPLDSAAGQRPGEPLIGRVALDELGTTPWTAEFRARHYDSTRVKIPLPNF